MQMFKRVGWDTNAEVSSFLLCDSNKRPDIVIFQSLAAAYTFVFVGAFFVFARPGSAGEFLWDRTQRTNVGLGTQYVSSPSLIRVPTRTAVLYGAVWPIC